MAVDTILVAVGPGDPERSALQQETLIDIAAPTGAAVTLAHVFDEDEFQRALRGLDYDPEDRPNPNEVVARYERHRDLDDRLQAADIRVEHRGVRRGDQPRGLAIVELAGEIEADLIFVGGQQRSPAGKAVFGSTAQDVLLNAHCPVVYVGGE